MLSDKTVVTNARIHLKLAQISELRKKKLIAEGEIAFISGDLLVAENVTTSARRILGEVNKMLNISEGTKRVLLG